MRVLTVALCSIVLIGCSPEATGPKPETSHAREEPAANSDSAGQAWMEKPFDEWPQMLLTNEADFQGHTSLRGASAFLLETDTGKVVAATARHLIGSAGGVDPEIPPGELDRVLQSWKLFLRNQDSQKKVSVTGVAPVRLDDPNADWLILNISKEEEAMPAIPLQIRKTPVEVGETVYLIGVPYSDTKSTQNIYKGKVTEKGDCNRFRYSISPPANVRGFSGAPILDEKGWVVGVMTVWFRPKMSGDEFLEAGGEETLSIAEEINRL